MLSCVCREGAISWFWILAPQWHEEPRLVACGRRSLERTQLFEAARVPEHTAHQVVLRGGVWEGNTRPAHGDVVVITSPRFYVRSAPLFNVLHRVPDVQALLFCHHCPGSGTAAHEVRHRIFWRSAVANCQALFGLSYAGVRSTIAGISIPPMVVGTGSLVLPTTAQLQAFYDARLASRFGACVFRDTAHLDRDNALFVEVWKGHDQHLWVVRMPTGVDVRVADAAGDQLRNLHIGMGWFVQPVVRHANFGIACITRGTDLGEPTRQPNSPDSPSLMADALEFQVPPPTGQPIQHTQPFLEFVANIRALRDEGLLIAAPATPVAAFGGVPPPPLNVEQLQVGSALERYIIPDFEARFPIFARMLAMVPDTVAEATRRTPALLLRTRLQWNKAMLQRLYAVLRLQVKRTSFLPSQLVSCSFEPVALKPLRLTQSNRRFHCLGSKDLSELLHPAVHVAQALLTMLRRLRLMLQRVRPVHLFWQILFHSLPLDFASVSTEISSGMFYGLMRARAFAMICLVGRGLPPPHEQSWNL